MTFTPHPVTLRQLQYVVAVADQKSFRRAAEVCHVSQPSLSAQVAQAEDALGVRFFERDKRRVALTAAGEAVVASARQLLGLADELVESSRTLSDPFSGTLRIGVVPTLGPYLLPELAPALRRAFPRLAIVWAEDKTAVLEARLARAEIDGAILALEATASGGPRFDAYPNVVLGKDPFVFAAPPEHPLAASRKPIEAAELEGERVLLLDDGHCFREQALAICARAGAEEAGFRATSLATLVQMVAGGAGVTLLPSVAVPLENRHDALRIRPFSTKGATRTVALVWRRGSALGKTLERVGEVLAAAFATFTQAIEARTRVATRSATASRSKGQA